MKPLRNEEVEVQNIKLVRIVPDAAEASDSQQATTRNLLFKRLPFLLIVVLPTLLSAIYFIALAAPRYQSEVKFVVRTPGTAATSELASLVQGSGVIRAGDDAYIAKEFMLSRTAMQQMIDHDQLMDMFESKRLDILWSYPGLFHRVNSEGLLKHYLKFIKIDYDSSSGIATLTMQAFAPADAQRLAGALVAHTEAFLNGLNTRAQRDAIQSALQDVEMAKQRAYAALDQVTAFRNRETIVDPTKSSTGIVSGIAALSLELSTNNARLGELAMTTPESPEIAPLHSRATALQDQITRERQLLGGSDSALAPRIAEYERLLLDQQFAEKSFVSALASLEAARLDSERQRVFLETVSKPDLPDFPAYPYRLLSILGTFGIAYAVWRVVKTLSKDIMEHAKR